MGYGEARLTGAPHANFVEDLTHVAGLILLYGVLTFVPGTVDLIGVAAEGVDWDGDTNTFPPILGLLANMTVSFFGLVSVILGFQYLTSKAGSKFTSLMGLGITLLAWFPFCVNIASISFNANKGFATGGPITIFTEATQTEIVAIAILGVIGFYGYAGTVIGALTFLHWKMYRYFAGYAHTYTASYYRSRLSYYGFLTVMVGAVQVTIGAYVMDKFGDGQLPGPVAAGPFFVLFPELSILVGVCQFLLGLFILYRSTTPGVGPAGGNRDTGLLAFQCAAWIVFLISVGCQIIGQIALADTNAPALNLVNVIGFSVFPIYLDVMAHTTPENVTGDMFSSQKTVGSMA